MRRQRGREDETRGEQGKSATTVVDAGKQRRQQRAAGEGGVPRRRRPELHIDPSGVLKRM